jgi:hypothetical protein
MIVNQLRTYLRDRTTSLTFVNGVQHGAALEDTGRPHGVKIAKETCIPEGTYRVDLTLSPRFGRKMLLLSNVESDKSVREGEAQWTGIRVHDGKDIQHTEGCLLYGAAVKDGILVSGKLAELEAMVEKELAAGGRVLWVISRAEG